jgi:autotransporter-associated beta strand protein
MADWNVCRTGVCNTCSTFFDYHVRESGFCGDARLVAGGQAGNHEIFSYEEKAMRYWALGLCAALAFAPARFASAGIELHVGLAYEMSYDATMTNSTVLPNVAVPGNGASLSQVNVTPGSGWVNHVFNVYATVTGLAADQDVVFMQFSGSGSGAATPGAYTGNSYIIDPSAMGSPASDAAANTWSLGNSFNGADYLVRVQFGDTTANPATNTYGDYAAYMQLGEPGSANAPGPFLLGQQVLNCDNLGRYTLSFHANPAYFKVVNGNVDGAAQDFSAETYPAYSGFADSALFAPRAPSDVTWVDGTASTPTWSAADGQNHWVQTGSPTTTTDFYHLDTVRFTNSATTNRTVTLAGNLNPASVIVNSSGNYVFTGSGAIIGADTTLVKSGTGKLTIANTGANSYTGQTTLQGGTLQLNGASAQNPVLNLGGADIQQGKMVFDYSGTGETNPASTVLADLIAGYNGGVSPWTTGKLQSSTAAANNTTLGWVDDPVAKQLTVMAVVPGDFTLDGTVNLADYNLIKANFGTGTTWVTGDANYDGVVNLDDYNIMKTNFGVSFPTGAPLAGAAVPEPGTLALLAGGLIGLLACAWRKRK